MTDPRLCWQTLIFVLKLGIIENRHVLTAQRIGKSNHRVPSLLAVNKM